MLAFNMAGLKNVIRSALREAKTSVFVFYHHYLDQKPQYLIYAAKMLFLLQLYVSPLQN